MPYASDTYRPQTEDSIVNVAGARAPMRRSLRGYSTRTCSSSTRRNRRPARDGSRGRLTGYGGRKLTDDVVDIGLYAIFSSLLSPDGASCAPGALPLCTDNVNANDKPFSSTFPYLAAPTL